MPIISFIADTWEMASAVVLWAFGHLQSPDLVVPRGPRDRPIALLATICPLGLTASISLSRISNPSELFAVDLLHVVPLTAVLIQLHLLSRPASFAYYFILLSLIPYLDSSHLLHICFSLTSASTLELQSQVTPDDPFHSYQH